MQLFCSQLLEGELELDLLESVITRHIRLRESRPNMFNTNDKSMLFINPISH